MTSAAAAPGAAPNRFLITVALMSATVLQVLDITIVNVALPHMAGSLGATLDNISWVLTSYLIGASIMMPLTGYFTERIGRRRFLLGSVAGFVVASGFCGISTNLPEIVLLRFLQGLFGASIVPLAQAVMAQTYPAEERGRAMAIWGMGVMVAPILGPTLGGWLTESFSWRWTFYINLPVGIASLALSARYIPDTPRRNRDMDWLGFGALAVSLTALQLLLDRGEQLDWFASAFVRACAYVAGGGFAFFLWRAFTQRAHPVLRLQVLRDRNLAIACSLMAVVGMGMYGAQLLLPEFFESLLNFPAFDAGLWMAPRGVAMFFAMMLVGRLSGRVPLRSMIGSGVLCAVAGSYLATRLNGDVTGAWFLPALVLQGAGMGLIFVPMSTLAFSTIGHDHAAEAAGIYSLVRSVGSAIGISVVSTYLTRATQAQWELMRGQVTPFHGAAAQYLRGLHLAPSSPLGVQLLAQAVGDQARLAAFVDALWLITASFAAMLPLLLLLRAPRRVAASPVQSVE